MDPNEYDSLLATLVASFSNINSEIIVFSIVVLGAVIFFPAKRSGASECDYAWQGAGDQSWRGL